MIRSLFLLLVLVLWIAVWVPPIALFHYLKKKKIRHTMIRKVNQGIMRIMGIRVTAQGEMSDARPLLIVSNHISYMDVWVLGSVASVAFAPKSEIAHWPFVSLLCRLMDCVFIDRAPGKIHKGVADLSGALANGSVVALFPEATTGEGKHLLPFKPAFFGIATTQSVTIQPVAIVYKKINGLPIDTGQWPLIAWYGDMLLLPHLFTFLNLGKVEVEVRFLSPLEPATDRKALANAAEMAISYALTNENTALLTKD